MGRGVSLVTIIVVVLLVLGFHYVTYPTARGRKLCVLPKSQMTFDSTFVSGTSEALFDLQHPYIATRIATGHGVCLSY